MGDWEEEASVAILGSVFSLGSGAATATADADHAPSQGRNDGSVQWSGGDRTCASVHGNQDRPPV